MCLQAVVAAAIVLVRHDWPRIFTTSPAVIERTAHLLPLFALRSGAILLAAVLHVTVEADAAWLLQQRANLLA